MSVEILCVLFAPGTKNVRKLKDEVVNMKEKLYTIPLNDAVNEGDECPFCVIERNLEQDMLDFVLGSCASYMESDVRDATDREGMCRMHFKKMFDYGNTLGNAWILKTHYDRMIREMEEQMKSFKPVKMTVKERLTKGGSEYKTPIGSWVAKKEESCYICNRYKDTYDRYIDTFFVLYDKDPEFRKKIAASKGFCLPHFGDVCEAAKGRIPEKQAEEFYNEMFRLMRENMARLSEDVSWLVNKFDYRYKDADWKNSKDAIQRGMQKLKGGYPADQPYRMQK